MSFAFALLLLVADDFDARLAAAPADVRAFVGRKAECDHWLGEEPYDADRAREIEAALSTLACDGIDRQEMGLRQHYAGNREITLLLDDADKRAR